MSGPQHRHPRRRAAPASALAVLAMVALTPPASAQEPGAALAIHGFLPGNWTLFESPDPEPDAVAAQCRTGMIVALDDGRWFGMVALPDAEPPQVVVDGRAVCDEGPKGALCRVALTPVGDVARDERFFMEFDVDPAGNYWLQIRFLDAGGVSQFYPQRCSGDDLHDMLVETFAPRP